MQAIPYSLFNKVYDGVTVTDTPLDFQGDRKFAEKQNSRVIMREKIALPSVGEKKNHPCPKSIYF